MAEILAALTAVESLAAFIQRARDSARRTGEMTPEQDAAIGARMEVAFTSDSWKTDAELAQGAPPADPNA
jgi:hypothetical protein